MGKKLWIYFFATLAVIGVIGWYVRPTSSDIASGAQQGDHIREITTFDECVAAGFPVRESYPPVCVTSTGLILTQNIGNELELKDLIVVNIRPNQKVTSPIIIDGKARGSWFFEGQFSAKLLGEKGEILGNGIMQADAEWMTTGFVPYSGEIEFKSPTGSRGKLILEKSNPSDLPENSNQLIVPVMFR